MSMLWNTFTGDAHAALFNKYTRNRVLQQQEQERRHWGGQESKLLAH